MMETLYPGQNQLAGVGTHEFNAQASDHRLSTAPFRNQEVEERAIARLENHPHFQGRSKAFQVRCHGQKLSVFGQVPTYYLKQLAQEALREIEGVSIENQIVVLNSNGLMT
ncbi:MAG: BON domain-containing protein [Planctomycetota bacterium]